MELEDRFNLGKMLIPDPDANLTSLGPKYYKLRKILDEDDRWASLLEVLPFDDCNELEKEARDAELRPNTSPAAVILWRLASKGVTVQMIKGWLKEIQLEKALIILEDEAPVSIVSQPPAYVILCEGEELAITCQAIAFPHPEFQWFKNNEDDKGGTELEGQNRSTLRIPSVQLEDAGVYVCRVHTNFMDGCPDFAFSAFSAVEVVPSGMRAAPCPHAYTSQLQQPPSILLDNVKMEKDVEDSKDMKIFGRWCEINSTVKTDGTDKKDIRDLKIIKHPVSPGTVNQGSTVVLECKAQSSLPVHYQWYCNGIKMPGETSHKLQLSDLYLDSYMGEYYHCEVSTEAESLYSRSASIQLNGFDDSTQYFASDKVALLMANSAYEELANLLTPPNDVSTLSSLLKSIGFKVIVLMNLNLIEMKMAVHIFCGSLRKGSYGLVYYAGHGFEQFGQSYFQPIDADGEYCIPHECVCVEEILENMQAKEPALSVLLIDMCRKLPSQYREGKDIQPGKIYEPKMKRNIVYGYATSFLCAAYENKKCSHGYFMKHLKKHITKEQSILDILQIVKCDFENDPAVKKLQYPWIGSSLTARRKLTDSIIDETSPIVADDITWKELQSPPFHNIGVRLPYLGMSVFLEFHLHKEEFCNAADLYMYVEPENEETCANICQLDVSFRFNLTEIHHNKREVDTSNASRICCCITEIFGLQKIKRDFAGILRITHRQTGQEIVNETLPFVQPPIARFGCAEFCHRLHNQMNGDSHRLIMDIVPRNTYVQNHHHNIQCESAQDLITFTDEITFLS